MFEEFTIFIAIAASGVVAAFMKAILHWWRDGTFSWYVLLWETGGMPSTHSAGVASLATIVLLVEGFSTAFWISLVLAIVVIRDAFGVRRSVSDQAKVLNVLLSKQNVAKKVKVVLGHTPAQTAAGTILGMAVAIAVYYLVPLL